MKTNEFKEWLIENKVFTTKKQLSDCVSRTKMVERKFSEVFGNSFDLDKEYERDGLVELRKALSYLGQRYMNDYIPKGSATSFPIGRPSMSGLSNAILKYIRFMESKEK